MSTLDRRSMLGYSALGASLGLTGLPIPAAQAAPAPNEGADRFIIDDTSAVADTDCGKVMGYVRNDIRIFKGIPYGEITTPQARWKRSVKPKPWAGKFMTRAPGPICPAQDISATGEVALRDSDLLSTHTGEDCLRLNIWTPGVDGKKRQVLFYCHGGGFAAGSALMAARYEGHNLAKHGDVVVVSLTHRLNALGFLDLTAHGPEWADSANLGMLDVVDALKWVKANIANFGGDPAKVMIFGHSGGGAKVLTLLSMPEAKGLFNRAVSHSPGPLPLSTPPESAALAATYLKMLGVSPNNLDALYKMPVEKLIEPAVAINKHVKDVREFYAKWRSPENNAWRPVVDGKTVLYQPSNPTVASDVPLMTGTTLHELYGALGHPEYASMKEAEARGIVRGYFGPIGDGVYDTYKGIFPKAIPYEITAMARATGSMRAFVAKAAQRRAAIGAAPTYNYWFQWRANTFEGRAMSHHEIEMPLVFMNSDAVPTTTGGGADARALQVKMTDAWLAFARTGNPNTGALPHWNPATPKTLNTMVFNNDCHIDHDSDMAAIESFWKDRYPKA